MLRAVQQILMAALLDDDPAAALRLRLQSPADLTAEEHTWLAGLDPDGLAMTGLIVKKLRFERLTRADRATAELFEAEPERFVELFHRYTAAVPPAAYFPGHEAALYRKWREST